MSICLASLVRLGLVVIGIGLSFASLANGVTASVSEKAIKGAFPLVATHLSASLVVDDQDWPGVRRAAGSFQEDVHRVTGVLPIVQAQPKGSHIVVVGTLGKSHWIDDLVSRGKIDATKLQGQWEATLTQVVNKPWPGVEQALVIAGSDKRGTIYGLYMLSEKIGVSPWTWWADVPVKKKSEIYVSAGTYLQPSPSVKYRGIFLNDEAPNLTNWVLQNFGEYKHGFYEHVFELLLRLRANYLWPAMWNNCFSQDDPDNPRLADEYGIVMGTSHVEPMMRADKEWNRLGYGQNDWNYLTHPKELEKFWADGVRRNKPYENIITMAMRGKIDTPMSEEANIGLLEKIVAAQREIIKKEVNPDPTQVPQLWCLYKEVQEYYEKGMRVPDDITLLWADDNWGNIRRLPTPEERHRSGGAGVYYHFDYVGGPRNYKWLNTNPIPKIWEQMTNAYQYGADRIWIVNVGDLKPMEFPLEFFITMAWDPEHHDSTWMNRYTTEWAAREFGREHAAQIRDIMDETYRLTGSRKPELLEASTFSLLHYNEAESVLHRYRDAVHAAEAIAQLLPKQAQDAFFQLVLHPIKAPWIVNEMYVAAAKNALYAQQGRHSANAMADQVEKWFKADQDLRDYYHKQLTNGKWNHMMDQTHIGYTSWQQPEKDVMPSVQRVPPGVGVCIAVEGMSDIPNGDVELPHFERSNPRETHWFEVFGRGIEAPVADISTDQPWIKIVFSHTPDLRASVSVDWSRVPTDEHGIQGVVRVETADGVRKVHVRAIPRHLNPGFLESGGVVAMEARNFSETKPAGGAQWREIPNYGRTVSAMAPYPVTSDEPGAQLIYRFTNYTNAAPSLHLVCGPSLAFQPMHGLRVGVSVDGGKPFSVQIAPVYLSHEWEKAVSDSVREVVTKLPPLAPGEHHLVISKIDPGVVLERLVLDFGGLKPSYFGPPESYYSIRAEG